MFECLHKYIHTYIYVLKLLLDVYSILLIYLDLPGYRQFILGKPRERRNHNPAGDVFVSLVSFELPCSALLSKFIIPTAPCKKVGPLCNTCPTL